MAVKLLLAAAAVAAVWSFVPIGGRTMAARWHHARTPAELAEGLWAELSPSPPRHAHPAPRALARGRSGPARPTESHTEADRQALDRIVARHLEEP